MAVTNWLSREARLVEWFLRSQHSTPECVEDAIAGRESSAKDGALGRVQAPR